MDRLPLGRCPRINRVFAHSSRFLPTTNEEKKQFYDDKRVGLKHFLDNQPDKSLLSLLLDSSLITASNSKNYTIKVIQCGDYYQVYRYNNRLLKKDNSKEKIKNLHGKDFIYTDFLVTKGKYKKTPSRGVIEEKNINRSKFNLQRLIKSNENEFKTFITLTFKDNVTDIAVANKMFHSFRTYIQQLKSDFKYVCVPEFQKRGAVHYHLLTNIDYTDFTLLSQTEVKLWRPKNGSWAVGRNIRGWNKGFSLVINMTDVNVVGYLSKYMTKDIDNRLFGRRRYLYSSNLKKPSEVYIDLSDDTDFSLLADIMANSDITFDKTYMDIFGDVVDFTEYKKAPSGATPTE